MCFLAAVSFGLTGDCTSPNTCLPQRRLNNLHCSAPALEIHAFSSGRSPGSGFVFQAKQQMSNKNYSNLIPFPGHSAPHHDPREMLPLPPATPPHRTAPEITQGLFHTNPSRSCVPPDIPTCTGEFIPCRRSWELKGL